jgi:hypothetical protein
MLDFIRSRQSEFTSILVLAVVDDDPLSLVVVPRVASLTQDSFRVTAWSHVLVDSCVILKQRDPLDADSRSNFVLTHYSRCNNSRGLMSHL